jgi:hypothetical protein
VISLRAITNAIGKAVRGQERSRRAEDLRGQSAGRLTFDAALAAVDRQDAERVATAARVQRDREARAEAAAMAGLSIEDAGLL